MRPATAPAARFLASVTSLAEARVALQSGADVIDAKNPATGALGALPLETIREIRTGLPGGAVISATIGDLPCEPDRVASAVAAVAALSIDYVKVGFFPGGDRIATIAAAGRVDLGRARLVGLLLADQGPDLSLIPHMARAGFAGVMIDTAGKDQGSLTKVLGEEELRAFIMAAKANGLFSGLAGSLRVCDVALLMRLKPNVLGFRGALCSGGVRTSALVQERVSHVRAEIDRWAPTTADADARPTSAAE